MTGQIHGAHRSHEATRPRSQPGFTRPPSGRRHDERNAVQGQRPSRPAPGGVRGAGPQLRPPSGSRPSSGRHGLRAAAAGTLGVALAIILVVFVIEPAFLSGGAWSTPDVSGFKPVSGGIGPATALWRTAATPGSFPVINGDQACFGKYCFSTASSDDMNSEALLYSDSGGESWSVATVPDGEDVEVPGACYQGKCTALTNGVSGQVAYSADWGRSWKVTGPLKGGSGLSRFGMTCSHQYCLLSGTGEDGSSFFKESANNGRNWSQPLLPAGVQAQSSPNLSCDGENCVISVSSGNSKYGDNEILTSAGGGTSWSASELPPSVSSVSPPSCVGSKCITGAALASAGTGSALQELLYSVDSGRTWSVSGLPVKGLDHLFNPTCNTASCTAIGSAGTDTYTHSHGSLGNTIIYSKDNGRSWEKASVPAAIKNVEVPSCTGSTCVASANADYSASAQGPVATRLLYSNDGGATWRVARTPGGILFPDSATCWSGGCVEPATYGDSGLPLFSTDSGANWSRALLPAGLVQTSAAAKCSPAMCVLAGTIDKGATNTYTRLLYLWK